VLNPNKHWPDKLLDSSPNGLVLCQVQVDISLMSIISPMIGHKALFGGDFQHEMLMSEIFISLYP
jgi:alkyl hydroperoxide reductase subunit AhpF